LIKVAEITIAISLVSLLVGYALGRYRTHIFQNRGEARLSRALQSRFAPPDYHLLNHLTLRLDGGTTQIDHVLISRFGVFVIETKNYKGWIFAGPSDRHWTQVLYQSKYRYQNPIHQNVRHVRAVQGLLDFLPPGAIRSIVVFTGDAEFKTTIPDGVFKLPAFLAHVERYKMEVMSMNSVQFCIGRLESARLSITKRTDVQHVQRLRRRYGSYE
jgi:hypothetical protein